MKLAKALNEKLMDVRLVDRLMAQGKITKEEVDKATAELADEQGNFEQVENATSAPVTDSTEL